jgi:methyl-accepting chemotaxis protein
MDLIFSEIKIMDSAFSQVNKAVEEQAAGGAQILTAISSIKNETEIVRTGSEDIQKQSGSISGEMHKLQQISENVSQRVHEVNEASKQISSVLENAKEIIAS